MEDNLDITNMISAWTEASKDLKFKIKSPFILTTDKNENIRFEILVEDFGNKKGTIILSIDDMTNFSLVQKYGYYCSAINPETYKKYNKSKFIDILNDWGYFGEEKNKPDWYTGKPWTF